ncbi:hypothetical protein TSOC_008900 [Tetrabaena socialis]|uniref:Apple domain-containing protein n=1 Tax=Tetrabaena socialis TaxID=47790 RepID=A0A2J7ZX95_9CHLO|nr:hypothetical protein TSOC_008900 [Tetrabaena socialis]|eukprot:PNH04875.1 hypothetical protein TSOC_008900 [Tetrabaena socialis]
MATLESCQSFNWVMLSDNVVRSYLKNATGPLKAFPSQQPRCMGIYVKAACPIVYGYTFTEFFDVQGFDINLVNGVAPPVGSKTVNDLALQCANNRNCQSFNWVMLSDNVVRSYLKSAVGPLTAFPSQQLPCTGIYVKAACPRVSGYTFTEYFDVQGFDINLVNGIAPPVGNKKVNDLALQCTNTPGCQSFNWVMLSENVVRSYLKSAVGPLTAFPSQQARCMGIYVKAACPRVSGYTFTEYFDVQGFDINLVNGIAPPVGNKKVNDLALQCANTRSCQSFNWVKLSDNVVRSYLKSAVGPLTAFPSQQPRCMGIYVKAACPIVYGYTFTEFFDVQGFDINLVNGVAPPVGSKTVNDLALQCANNRNCQSFNWVMLSDNVVRSYLKSAVGPLTAFPSQQPRCMGIYVKAACPIVYGYTFTEFFDVQGFDINLVNGVAPPVGSKTVNDLALQCANNRNCQSFNWVMLSDNVVRSYLKSAVGPLTAFPSQQLPCTGIYVKAACPRVSGYTFTEYFDVQGFDINLVNGIAPPVGNKKVNDLALQCANTRSCQSFNWVKLSDNVVRSYLKSAVGPLTAFPSQQPRCMGIYVKVACPIVYGYTFTEHYDVQGFDINLVNGVAPPVGSKTVNDLALQCANNRNCQSFNWVMLSDNVVRSYLKSAAGPLAAFPSQQLPCTGIYVKVACPIVSGYTFTEYYDVQGFDINLVNGIAPPVGNKKVNDLAFQCTNTPGCQSFNWVMLSDNVVRSYLKSAVGPLKAFPSQQARCMGIYLKGGRV